MDFGRSFFFNDFMAIIADIMHWPIGLDCGDMHRNSTYVGCSRVVVGEVASFCCVL